VSNRYSYYDCNSKKTWKITGRRHDEKIAINRRLLDQKVWEGLTGLLDDPGRLQEQLQAKLGKKIDPTKLPASDDKTKKELEKLDFQEKRIVDAYRESVISLEELKEQKSKITINRKVLDVKIKAAQSQQESSRQPEITMDMLGDISARYHKVMVKADFPTREKLVNILVNSVKLFPSKAVVEGIIPVTSVDALVPSNRVSKKTNILPKRKRAGQPSNEISFVKEQDEYQTESRQVSPGYKAIIKHMFWFVNI
jgi:hypothetical protein